MPCVWHQIASGVHQCEACRRAVEIPQRIESRTAEILERAGVDCGGKREKQNIQPPGPGTILHTLLRRWLGADVVSGCKCSRHIAEMNRLGVEGCKEHLDEITGWLVEEAGRRGWPIPATFAAWGAKRLILAAVRKAERLRA